MGIRALVFDFDGLLLETEGPLFRSWGETYAAFGLDLSIEEWSAVIGTADAVDPLDELERRTGRRLDRQALHAARRARRDELLEAQAPCRGVLDLTGQCLELGLAMAVASSSPTVWVRTHLERLGLLDRFAYLACFEGRGAPKPAPDLYLRALAALGVEAEECIAFEDSHNGLLAAKAAGLRCVVVPTEMTRHMDFTLADMVLPHLGSAPLVEIIAELGATGPRPVVRG